MAARKATPSKIALLLADISQVEVARECKVTAGTVCAVLNERSRSQKIENWIAAATGLPLAQLWPRWYGANSSERSAARRAETRAQGRA